MAQKSPSRPGRVSSFEDLASLSASKVIVNASIRNILAGSSLGGLPAIRVVHFATIPVVASHLETLRKSVVVVDGSTPSIFDELRAISTTLAMGTTLQDLDEDGDRQNSWITEEIREIDWYTVI